MQSNDIVATVTGRGAARNGYGIGMNPYPHNSNEWFDWLDGFDKEMRRMNREVAEDAVEAQRAQPR